MELEIFSTKYLNKLFYLGFFRRAGQSVSLMVSPARNTLAIFWMSWWERAGLAKMALRVASGSSLKRVGTGPAAASPSNMEAATGQLLSFTYRMLSL